MEKGKLWKRNWIENGVEVIHRDNVCKETLVSYKMYVEKIVYEKLQVPISGKASVRIKGVRCYWFDKNNELKNGLFHTTHLIPFNVAMEGIDIVNQWISRDDKV